MHKMKLVTFAIAVVWVLSLPVQADTMYFCGSGTYRNVPTCSPSACPGTLIPTCTAPEGSSSGSATLSFIQGVCDDLGPVACAGKFKAFFEGCGGTRYTNAGLNTARVAGIVRVCFDPSGGGQCTGSGIEILRGTERWETSSIATAPNNAQGDHTFSTTKGFTFNGKKMRLSITRGFSITSGEGGACNTADCGFAGCLYKTR